MNEEEIKQTVIRLLKNIAPDMNPEELQPDDSIRQTLGIDSFDSLQFVVAMDEAFGIDTPEEDYGKIQTMKSLLEYIKSRMRK
ncbi:MULTISPECIES: acyl carrier protein [unclassified Imperialibacter]|uniref:acyl carrier protein n=1 Tax=unclassified Imperialibacter TaxID=2629706 RepID=UPI00125B7938|nr:MULTISPECIES: phosphopantetheine-binding protein [unclassified Imperialibacter]CAD5265396.1 conserved hypothetical protein [Imperialibacter sp. 89]CAD5270252.1 conserved hypothetical protein [Imperialibacter sp. 75]VVT09876.1 conserved hypothetical protein [Imperialibacter sp. EC-SDR9]